MFGSLKKKQYLCIRIRKKMIFRGVAQLVAFLVWDQAVAGSSPVTPTKTYITAEVTSTFAVFVKRRESNVAAIKICDKFS